MFCETYEESRDRFRGLIEPVRAGWPAGELGTYALCDYPELTIDWIAAAAPAPQRLFVLTAGIHGIEGYVGAAMIELFVDEFLAHLDPGSTGLLLVHAVNPWGMKHRRRCNPRHVDLNRNALPSWQDAAGLNLRYDRALALLSRPRPLGRTGPATIRVAAGAVRLMAEMGLSGGRDAILAGQYRHPDGFYYGGSGPQEETRVLLGLMESALAAYDRIVHIDLHTGYGPRRTMTIVHPAGQPGLPAEWEARLGYRPVVRTNPEEFYSIAGEPAGCWQALRDARFPGKEVYAAGFEFGTFGDSFVDQLRSLRASVLMNELEVYGAVDRAAAERIRGEYDEQYLPSGAAWRAKALEDARRGFAGVVGWSNAPPDRGRAGGGP